MARREQTRERLLRAGREILTTAPVGGIGTHVRSGDVTKRAELSTGSLYYHWLSQDDYILDLVEYVLASMSDQRVARANHHADDVFTAALRSGQPLAVAVRDAGNQVFGQLQDDPTVFVQMALWAAHRDDPEISSRLKDMYERVEECWVRRIEETVKHQGRQWRSPFTANTMVTTLIALAEGLLLRAKVDPDAVSGSEHSDGTWSLFATTTLSLYTSMTVPGGKRPRRRPEDIRDIDFLRKP